MAKPSGVIVLGVSALDRRITSAPLCHCGGASVQLVKPDPCSARSCHPGKPISFPSRNGVDRSGETQHPAMHVPVAEMATKDRRLSILAFSFGPDEVVTWSKARRVVVARSARISSRGSASPTSSGVAFVLGQDRSVSRHAGHSPADLRQRWTAPAFLRPPKHREMPSPDSRSLPGDIAQRGDQIRFHHAQPRHVVFGIYSRFGPRRRSPSTVQPRPKPVHAHLDHRGRKPSPCKQQKHRAVRSPRSLGPETGP